MDFLLRSGGRVGEKQLISAVSAAPPGIVQAILNRGVDVNAGAFRGRALIVAAMRGDPRFVEVLIRAGADLNARDRNECTALRWAKHRDHAAAVQVLEAAAAR